jgi:LPS sulfotransferase NodH
MEQTPPYADGIWSQQFDSAFDFASTPVTKQYILCTSPRSGSHFLGHLLHQAGGFGYPLEYVQKANYEVWTQRAREAGYADTLAFVKSVRTDKNGVFGIKAHHRHLPRLLEVEKDVLNYRFIVLERRDLLKQAVSYCWAAQTKSWISTMPPVKPATYDWDMIAEKMVTITRSNAGWRNFIACMGIKSCDLVFEDVRANPTATIHRVADFIGVEPPRTQPGRDFFPAEQVEREKDEWIQRFKAEARERLQRGQLLGDEKERDGRSSTLYSAIRRLLGGKGRQRQHI